MLLSHDCPEKFPVGFLVHSVAAVAASPLRITIQKCLYRLFWCVYFVSSVGLLLLSLGPPFGLADLSVWANYFCLCDINFSVSGPGCSFHSWSDTEVTFLFSDFVSFFNFFCSRLCWVDSVEGLHFAVLVFLLNHLCEEYSISLRSCELHVLISSTILQIWLLEASRLSAFNLALALIMFYKVRAHSLSFAKDICCLKRGLTLWLFCPFLICWRFRAIDWYFDDVSR